MENLLFQIDKRRGEIQCEYRTRFKQKNRRAYTKERTSAKLKTVC